MNNNQNLTETDIDIIDDKFQIKHRTQTRKTIESGSIFDKINSMKLKFYKTGELKGSSYIKIPLRSSAILTIQNVDKNCFLWSISADLHPCENSQQTRVKNYLQNSNELIIEGFDSTNAFKCSDVQNIETLNNLSINILEVILYQDKNN